MTASCCCVSCCSGPLPLTPLSTTNRPGLEQLQYRVGTHGDFVDAMRVRLSSPELPELAGLTTRETSDFSVALLDAFAVVADVLTFYQERIANEGYLRTAIERRSLVELSRLVGYSPRPGVAASAYLAYVIEKDSAEVTIPAGTRASSVPNPGEQMQTFETAEPLVARVEWNELVLRTRQPQSADSIGKNGLYVAGTTTRLKANDPLLLDYGSGPLRFERVEAVETDAENTRTRLVLRGAAAAPAPAVAVRKALAKYSKLTDFDVSADAAMTKRVLAMMSELAGAPRTIDHLGTVTLPKLESELAAAREGHFTKLAPWIEGLTSELRAAAATPSVAARRAPAQGSVEESSVSVLSQAVTGLSKPPEVQPAGARQLPRTLGSVFAEGADTLPRLLASFRPRLSKSLYAFLRNTAPQSSGTIAAYALRVSAAPFGHNAPLRLTGVDDGRPSFDEWTLDDPLNSNGGSTGGGDVILAVQPRAAPLPPQHTATTLFLDAEYDVKPDSFVVVERASSQKVLAPASLSAESIAAYGMSGKTTRVELHANEQWLDEIGNAFAPVRTSRVFTGSEGLVLADEPIAESVAGNVIELATVYEDLEPGRWLIVAGEREDLLDGHGNPVRGVKSTELVMLAAVEQRTRQDEGGAPLTREVVHTFITLATELAYAYRRDSVKIFGNVVRATHGETRREVLGSGDARTSLQEFGLKQAPLTHVSAPTASGAESTLQVRVNDVEWHEAASLFEMQPEVRAFVTRQTEDSRVRVTFGTGPHGARVPTGVENVTATYRSGIGRAGNVAGDQLSLASDKPLGVKGVTNPIRASGGADADSDAAIRENTPLSLMALDRLVSTRDYRDFARVFAGVAKAEAERLSDGRRQVLHVTVAGDGDAPLEPTADLLRNLQAAAVRYGDPSLPVVVAARQRLLLVVSAKVKLLPDYAWELQEPKIRTALLQRFGFERCAIAHDVLLADLVSSMQRVAGVDYVDVDIFDALSEAQVIAGFSVSAASYLRLRDRVVARSASAASGSIAPAEVAYLAPEIPDTLVLQELK
jgi:predicted phage baseplate assembly protein